MHSQNLEKPQSTLTFNKPFIVIAHRGDSSRAPENTLPAFQKAMDAGADMIEMDVQITTDGVPVVFHDVLLNEHTNGVGLLSDFSLKKLRSLDAGSWFSKDFIGEKVPLLREALELTKGKMNLNIEIKAESVTEKSKDGIEERVCKEIGLFEMENQVIISSFDYRVLERVKKISPSIKTGLLFNKKQSGKLSPSELVQNYGSYSFHCNRWQLRKRWIAECRKIGVPIFVYTVNNSWAMKTLIKKGVAGIFSDHPKRLKDVSKDLFSS